jgi:hypothetical protein
LMLVGPQGKAIRTYPAGTQSVEITTGSSPGNDLDMVVFECPSTQTDPDKIESCSAIAQSGGPTDEEKVVFTPKPDQTYVTLVVGYAVKDAGAFVSSETIRLTSEKGSIRIVGETGSANRFRVNYGLSAEQMESSKLLKSELFTSGVYHVSGALTLRTKEKTVLGAVPVRVSAKPAKLDAEWD